MTDRDPSVPEGTQARTRSDSEQRCARPGCSFNGEAHRRRDHYPFRYGGWRDYRERCRPWAGDTGTPVPCQCDCFVRVEHSPL